MSKKATWDQGNHLGHMILEQRVQISRIEDTLTLHTEALDEILRLLHLQKELPEEGDAIISTTSGKVSNNLDDFPKY